MMTNAEIARALLELADALDRSGAPKARYKARAIKAGALAIDSLRESAVDLLRAGELTRVRGIGDGIARRVEQLLAEGRFPDLDTLAAAPARQRRSRRHRRADDAPGLRLDAAERELEPLAARAAAAPGVTGVDVAGAIRRRRDLVDTADLVIAVDDPARAGEALDWLLAGVGVAAVEQRGPAGATLRTRNDLTVVVHLVPAAARGTALLMATGTAEHVAAVDAAAGALPAAADEQAVYAAAGLPWLPPELREGTAAIDAARAGTLPRLVEVADLRGDLHMHTVETDGRDTLVDMVEAAAALGREYVAITDHSFNLKFVGGLDPVRLRRQGAEIRALDEQLAGRIRVLRGIEADILADGSIDLADVVGELDWVIGSVHSHMDLPRDEQTRRMVAAIETGLIDVVGHPTGRMIGRRRPYEVDMEAVVDAAVRCGVALEINAYPDRLDLKDEHARLAAERGAWMVIDTDSHAISHLRNLAKGVDVARRAWLEPKHLLNTRPLAELLSHRSARRGRAARQS
jgi:DNA polymerase (family 10)